MEAKPTAKVAATDAILAMIDASQGPIASKTLMENMLAAGHSRHTTVLAKRDLTRQGVIRIFRPNTRTNPYFVERCPKPEA